MGRWRNSIEAGIQAEPDGTFVVRPFVFLTSTYLLPDSDAREHYISRRDWLESRASLILTTVILGYLFVLAIDYYSQYKIIYANIICISFLSNLILLFFPLLYRDFVTRKILKSVGARRLPRVRWLATNPGNPFASASSSQLGGLFILFVALSTLLGSILIASYFGPRSDHGGMPYLLVLFTLAVIASLAVAFWLELWMRDRRKGGA